MRLCWEVKFNVVVKMSPSNSIEKLLDGFKENSKVSDATLISRSGMHIAGKVPENAHRETFVAMSAILLGAAETATSELKEELSHVVIELKKTYIIILNCGPKALLALKMSKDKDLEDVISEVSKTILKIEDEL